MKTQYFKSYLVLIFFLLSALFSKDAVAQFDRQSQRRDSFGSSTKTSQSTQTNTSRTNVVNFSQTQSSSEIKNVPSAQNIKDISQRAQNLINTPSSDTKRIGERMENLGEERKNLLWSRYVEPGSPANAYRDAGGGAAGQNAQRAFELWGQGYSVKNVELRGGYTLDAEKGRITNREGQDVTTTFLKDLSKDVQITRITFDNGESVGGYEAAASEVLFYVNLVQGSPEKAVETLLIDSRGQALKLSQRKNLLAHKSKKEIKPPIQPSGKD
jgi:hypothetical protein